MQICVFKLKANCIVVSFFRIATFYHLGVCMMTYMYTKLSAVFLRMNSRAGFVNAHVTIIKYIIGN